MATKSHPAVCVYGAEVIQRYLSAFRKEYPGVLRSRDIEYVHRMRVASRRLNTALTIFHDDYPNKRMRIWQKDIRQTARILGQARDLDIQSVSVRGFLKGLSEPSNKPGVRRLLLRIVQRRQKAQRKLLTIMDDLDSHGTLVAIDIKSATLAKTDRERFIEDKNEVISFARKVIQPGMEKFLSYDPYVDQVDAIEELHAMRLAAKSLRYTLECFAPIYENELDEYLSAMRKIQEYLGIIHDCDIWESSRVEFIESERQQTQKYFGTDRPMRRLKPGLTCFFDYRRTQRNESYAAFVKYWSTLRKRRIWEILRKEVTTARSIHKQSNTL